jgi:hypothetical protein
MCQVNVAIVVRDLTNAAITDAVVTLNDQPVPHASNALYGSTGVGLAESYRLVVVHGGDTYSTTLTSPRDYTASVSPSAITANTPATLTWTPSGEPGVTVQAQVVTSGTDAMVTDRESSDDDGQIDIPASAFPMPGDYRVEMVRTVTPPQPDAGPFNTSTMVQLSRLLQVTVN